MLNGSAVMPLEAESGYEYILTRSLPTQKYFNG